ncbi:MAG: hypothetical protein PUK70_01635 [Bacteroidales bacterium]|nr:hypothetical protein [Bacteroidales bacterium]MDY6002664.1 hypothetical protein [Candidatus Cryptobacteroides sp.]
MKKAVACIACMIALFCVGYLLGRQHKGNDAEGNVTMKVDTVIVIDTVVRETPVIREISVIRHDTVRIETIRHDTVQVAMPVERKVYSEDSLYFAVVSGWKPSLDSLIVYPKTIFVNREKITFHEQRKWLIGISAGPSVLVTTDGKLHGGLGVTAGLTYRF